MLSGFGSMGCEVFQGFRAKVELYGTLPTRSNSSYSLIPYDRMGVYHPVQAWSININPDASRRATDPFPGILRAQIIILNSIK